MTWRPNYKLGLDTSTLEVRLVLPVLDEAYSPPLSRREIREIRESEREFKAGKSRKFDTPDAAVEFLKTL